VAEDEGLVGVRADADRSRRLSGHGAGGEEEESDEQPPHSSIIANHDTSAGASSFGRRNLPAKPARNRAQVCAQARRMEESVRLAVEKINGGGYAIRSS